MMPSVPAPSSSWGPGLVVPRRPDRWLRTWCAIGMTAAVLAGLLWVGVLVVSWRGGGKGPWDAWLSLGAALVQLAVLAAFVVLARAVGSRRLTRGAVGVYGLALLGQLAGMYDAPTTSDASSWLFWAVWLVAVIGLQAYVWSDLWWGSGWKGALGGLGCLGPLAGLVAQISVIEAGVGGSSGLLAFMATVLVVALVVAGLVGAILVQIRFALAVLDLAPKVGGRAEVVFWTEISCVAVVAGASVWLVGSSRVDLQACKLEYSIVSPK